VARGSGDAAIAGWLFADTSFHIALASRDDAFHARAVAARREADDNHDRLVTTSAVLLEVLAYFSRFPRRYRLTAAEYADAVYRTSEVVETTRDLMARAIDLYAQRADQRYSLCDCLSMVVCRDLGITRVLTADRDFVAEGFEALLTP
jgi:predicted nucleic acid-binding protein